MTEVLVPSVLISFPPGTVIDLPYSPDNVTTWNVALLQQQQNPSEPSQRGRLSSEPGASAPLLTKVIPPDNLPNAQIDCSASTTTNLSEPFYGIGVTVLEVASGFAPQHVMSSFHALITRNALYLQQPNFSEVSRGDSVVDVYDKCLPTHWSAQPPPSQRLMPELPDEALASLKVPHCMVPSILRRILQH